MNIVVTVPTYNEAQNIEALVTAILQQDPRIAVLVADDSSPDGTAEIVRAMEARDRRVRLLLRKTDRGRGRAGRDAFVQALAQGADLVFEMDADFSHDPRYLPALLAAIDAGADVAVGSRYVEGGGTRNWGLGRRLISRAGGRYARTVLGLDVRDMTAGFVCYRREALERIDLDAIKSNGYSFQIEMKYRAHLAGLRIAEVPIVFEDRRVGQSKMSRAIVAEALWMVWKLRLGL